MIFGELGPCEVFTRSTAHITEASFQFSFTTYNRLSRQVQRVVREENSPGASTQDLSLKGTSIWGRCVCAPGRMYHEMDDTYRYVTTEKKAGVFRSGFGRGVRGLYHTAQRRRCDMHHHWYTTSLPPSHHRLPKIHAPPSPPPPPNKKKTRSTNLKEAPLPPRRPCSSPAGHCRR